MNHKAVCKAAAGFARVCQKDAYNLITVTKCNTCDMTLNVNYIPSVILNVNLKVQGNTILQQNPLHTDKILHNTLYNTQCKLYIALLYFKI